MSSLAATKIRRAHCGRRPPRSRVVAAMCHLLAALVPLSHAAPAAAYRPFITEDATVAGRGVLQAEANWDCLKADNGDVDQVFTLVGPIYGVTERIELSVEAPFVVHHAKGGATTGGAGDLNLVGKVLLLEEIAPFPSVVVKTVAKLATGDYDRGLGTGDEDYSLVLAASKGVGPVQLHGQFGYTWVGDAKDPRQRDIALYGVAADYAIGDDFHAIGEVYGNQNTDPDEDDQVNAVVGITHRIGDNLTLDVSAKRGLTHTALEWGAGIGFTIDILE